MIPGRKPFIPDDRDWQPVQLKRLLDEGEARDIEWKVLRILDQGQTGHCVGFGTGGLLNADDEFHGSPNLYDDDCHDLYYLVKKYEGEPGAENGAYVRSGIIVAKDKGWVTHYAVLKSTTDIVEWLQDHGPVLMGTDWTEGMSSPDDAGVVWPTGWNQGGHCWWVCGYDPEERLFLCVNSWGENWGNEGYFWLTREGMDALMSGVAYPGEAWAVVGPTATGEDKRSLIQKIIDTIREWVHALFN